MVIAGAGSGRAPGPPCVAKAVVAAAIAATGPCRYPVTGDLGALRLRANWQYVPRPRAIVAKPEIALDEHVFVTTQMNPRFRRYKEGPNPPLNSTCPFCGPSIAPILPSSRAKSPTVSQSHRPSSQDDFDVPACQYPHHGRPTQSSAYDPAETGRAADTHLTSNDCNSYSFAKSAVELFKKRS